MSNQYHKHKLPFLVIVILLAFAAGALGQITTQNYFSENIYDEVLNSNNLTLDKAKQEEFVIREPKKVVVEEDKKTKQVHDKVKEYSVSLFKNPDLIKDEIDYYNFNSSLANGVVLTNDGWTVFPYDKTKINVNQLQEGYKVADHERDLYKVSDQVMGKNNNFIFIKLKQAQDLQVANFAEFDNLELGQSLIATNGKDRLIKTSLVGWKQDTNLIKQSDNLDKNMILRDSVTDNLNSGVVYNLSGKITAFVKNQEIYPLDNFSSNWNLVLFKEKPAKTSFGVHYINLEEVATHPELEFSGALIYHPKIDPVREGSPADKAGLKSGDIIMYINNQPVNQEHDLQEIIAQFKPEDKINITLNREGETKTISTELQSNLN